MFDLVKLQQLVNIPSESLDVELKQWIDPTSAIGIAKFAKGCIALRNNNGGHLLIGFLNDGSPDTKTIPVDVRKTFHADLIQAIVTKYASIPFAIRVDFIERSGQEYPVITVPSGVQTPVTARADLPDPTGGKPLIRDNAVYVRSIHSNNTVSSSEARRDDWSRIISICFDNREADVGRFVRRHLAGILAPDVFRMLFHSREMVPVVQQSSDRALQLLDEGFGRFRSLCEERKIALPSIGYREFSVRIDGDVPSHEATESFIQKLHVASPRHSGWKPWLILRNASDPGSRPYVMNGTWECFLPLIKDSLFGPTLDFWIVHPRGEFYHLRGLEDDFAAERIPGKGPAPGTQLDFVLQIDRLAEAISVAIAMAAAMGCDEKTTSLAFAVRWQGIQGRYLSSWAEPRRSFVSRSPSLQNEFSTHVSVPLETPPSSLWIYVEAVIKKLFACFAGTEIESKVLQDIVNETVNRHL